MLLRRPCEIRSSGKARAARPRDCPSVLDLGREYLVLQVPVVQSGSRNQLRYALCLGDGARQRLLTRNAEELSSAALEGVDDFLDVLDPREVRSAQPDRIDRGVCDQVGDRLDRARLADTELAGQGGRFGGAFGMRTPHTKNVRVAHADESVQMKLRIESTADETNAESSRGHCREGRGQVGFVAPQ